MSTPILQPPQILHHPQVAASGSGPAPLAPPVQPDEVEDYNGPLMPKHEDFERFQSAAKSIVGWLSSPTRTPRPHPGEVKRKVLCSVEGLADFLFVSALMECAGMNRYRLDGEELTEYFVSESACQMKFLLESNNDSPKHLVANLAGLGVDTRPLRFLYIRDNDVKVTTTEKRCGEFGFASVTFDDASTQEN